MVENFLTVGTQVLILFILIGIGVLCGKIRFFSPVTAKHLTNIVLYFVTPCVVVDAFHREFEPALLINLGITALCAVCIHIFSIALCAAVFRRRNDQRDHRHHRHGNAPGLCRHARRDAPDGAFDGHLPRGQPGFSHPCVPGGRRGLLPRAFGTADPQDHAHVLAVFHFYDRLLQSDVPVGDCVEFERPQRRLKSNRRSRLLL